MLIVVELSTTISSQIHYYSTASTYFLYVENSVVLRTLVVMLMSTISK